MTRSHNESTDQVPHVTFAAGYICRFLEDYANSRSLPPAQFAGRVAKLVFTATGGEILGPDDSVPALRGRPAKRNKTVESVAVAKRASRRTSGASVSAYWAKMSPLQRRREMTRRRAVAAANKKKGTE